ANTLDDIPIRQITADDINGDLLNGIHQVWMACEQSSDDELIQLKARFNRYPVSVHLVPSMLVRTLLNGSSTMIGDQLVISMDSSPVYGRNAASKRAFDLTLGSAILLLVLPLFAVIAIAIKLDSKGPVFFRQWRYGQNGKRFRIWKFRTMTTMDSGEDAFQQATPNDARVTRVGKFLRESSLDELPQLFNVVTGDMSLVGPRPHPVVMDDEYRELMASFGSRGLAKPGMTGLAQIEGLRGQTQYEADMKKRVLKDIHYLTTWSIWTDIRIIARTPVALLSRKNAY
ncbi:unnamed protein product, partial [Cyprideis torosa]